MSTAPRKSVGFVYNAPIAHTWTYEHDRGRNEVAHELVDEVLTTSVFAVDETDAQATRVAVQNLIDTGHEMVFTTSSGFDAVSKEMALENPDILFVQVPTVSGSEGIPNHASLDVKLYQAYYLAGLIAGNLTKTGVLGGKGSCS